MFGRNSPRRRKRKRRNGANNNDNYVAGNITPVVRKRNRLDTRAIFTERSFIRTEQRIKKNCPVLDARDSTCARTLRVRVIFSVSIKNNNKPGGTLAAPLGIRNVSFDYKF